MNIGFFYFTKFKNWYLYIGSIILFAFVSTSICFEYATYIFNRYNNSAHNIPSLVISIILLIFIIIILMFITAYYAIVLFIRSSYLAVNNRYNDLKFLDKNMVVTFFFYLFVSLICTVGVYIILSGFSIIFDPIGLRILSGFLNFIIILAFSLFISFYIYFTSFMFQEKMEMEVFIKELYVFKNKNFYIYSIFSFLLIMGINMVISIVIFFIYLLIFLISIHSSVNVYNVVSVIFSLPSFLVMSLLVSLMSITEPYIYTYFVSKFYLSLSNETEKNIPIINQNGEQ